MHAIKDEFGLYREKIFDDMLRRERKRTERTQTPFALIIIELRRIVKSKAKKSIRTLADILDGCFREIDIRGWYKQHSTIGIICPEVAQRHVEALQHKVESSLDKALPAAFREELSVSYICFPEIDVPEKADKSLAVYPEFKPTSLKKITEDIGKRCMDITIAAAMLAFTFPLFIIFSILIKTDSRGPVFFRQKRVGFGGRHFTFLKFRSMYLNNDDSAHQAFIKDFIHGQNAEVDEDTKVFKIKNDGRITPVGRFLRKTSLDELPQLINVLRGEMSLVGPRPAIPYEVDEYHIWHRRRVMEIKPGITGFWQVYGRSMSTFEKMVRMDIHYIKYRNLLLDIILLLKTPFSMFKGAY
ncbi:MAG: sugar transferase [Chitinispirillaceae bacterium]|nr:sugar transferase [Chitinispirillaceae bacterium]